VFIGTSLPYLLPLGLHEFEAWYEALGRRARGGGASPGSPMRSVRAWTRALGRFQNSFRQVGGTGHRCREGRRGTSPSTFTFLARHVHHSNLAEVVRPPAGPDRAGRVLPESATRCRWRSGRQAMTSKRPRSPVPTARPGAGVSRAAVHSGASPRGPVVRQHAGDGAARRAQPGDEVGAATVDGQQHAPRLRTVHHFKVAAPAEAVPG
jgi:hypothetical protein